MSAPDRALGREARRLVLVDLENVAGGSLRTLEAAVWAMQVVETALVVAPREQVIIGVSSIDGLFHAQTSWPRARVVLGFGRDGADHALLDVLRDEGVAERFGHISIVSGDGVPEPISPTCVYSWMEILESGSPSLSPQAAADAVV